MDTKKIDIPLTHRTYVKATAFILTVIMALIMVISIMGAYFMLVTNVYTTDKNSVKKDMFSNTAYENVDTIFSYILSGDEKEAVNLCEINGIYSLVFTKSESYEESSNKNVYWKYQSSNTYTKDEDYINFKRNNIYMSSYFENGEDVLVNVDMKISTNNSEYVFFSNIVDFMYSMKYSIYFIGIISFIIAILGFIFLMCSSGHRKGHSGIQSGWGTGIPFDMVTLVLIFLIYMIVMITGEIINERLIYFVPILIIEAVVVETAVTGWCMSFALRIKLGKWWKNTVVYILLHNLWKITKYLFEKSFPLIKKFFSCIPFVWKTVIIVSVITLFEFITFVACLTMYENDLALMLWILEKLILIPIVIYCAVCLKKFQKQSETLAKGDLRYKMKTDGLIGDFRKYAQTLNSISYGMGVAIEQRMKSERMKTELITNVSHDIKTPLTSIINYSDLINKENCNNPKIKEYSGVLLRQSERLKRLIDDLVEASKASTGNLEIILAPCEANIFIVQAVGEYSEKLENRNLEFITTQPEYPIMIMADGRRLWRVFDNLINNICKYAQSDTRVYMSLEKINNMAVITLKNTSHSPLNISADELMERFVRGDSSRSTEGNGLGLSIAKSLTELQNGTLNLYIDGDLFKVVLKFPVIN